MRKSLPVKFPQDEVSPCWPSGQRLGSCQNACPIGTDVPGYIMALARGNIVRAMSILSENNPLPSICGRACHHPCETICLRGQFDESIAIRHLKRYITDNTIPVSKHYTPTKHSEKVAVIGAGPSGLAAAEKLYSYGFKVTVYESKTEIGGMLVQGIPEFVLPRKVAKRDLGVLLNTEIDFRTGVKFGKDISIEVLRQDGFTAIYLALGAQKSLSLNLPGIQFRGVHHALPFLEMINSSAAAPQLSGRVVIIGGGNVGIDCARAAIRCGADEVHVACIECRDLMPAFTWEILKAEQEGVIIHSAFGPTEITGANETLTGVKLQHVEAINSDAGGRLQPVYSNNGGLVLAADSLIIAVGQRPDDSFHKGAQELATDGRGFIITDPETLATNVPGVYAGGDVTKLSTIVEAMAQGKRAAEEIIKYFHVDEKANESPLPPPKLIDASGIELPGFIQHQRRSNNRIITMSHRRKTFKEVDFGFTKKEAMREASRCWNCPVCGKCILERSQMCYETATRLFGDHGKENRL